MQTNISHPPLTATQAEAWHQLMAHAPVGVLLTAVNAGLVPIPCLGHSGEDLLTTLLNRGPESTGGSSGAQWWGAEGTERPAGMAYSALVPPYVRLAQMDDSHHQGRFRTDYLQFCRLALALLKRPDVRPFEAQPTAMPDGRKLATALDAALALNLSPVVETLRQDPRWPADWKAWSVRTLDQPARSHVPEAGLPWLHAAVAGNRTSLVATLLDMGVDRNALDKAGRTALYHATSPGMVDQLLEGGVDPTLASPRGTLVAHWAALQKRENYGKEKWQEMAERVLACAPDQAGAHAVLWIGEFDARISSYDTSTRWEKLAEKWAKEWNQKVTPAMAQMPLAELRREVTSGVMTGRMSMVAELGWSGLNSDGLSYPFGWIHSENLKAMFAGSAHTVRRGVWDRGLFMLGVQRLLNVSLRPSSRSIPFGPEFMELVSTNNARLEEVLSESPLSQWNTWMIETSATLQSPRNMAMWRRIGDAWENLFERHDLTDQVGHMPLGVYEKKLEQGWRPGPGAAAATNHADRALAHAASVGGVRFFSKKMVDRIAVWGKGLQGQEAQDWIVTALCALADAQAYLGVEEASIREKQELPQATKRLAEVVLALMPSLQAWPSSGPASVREKMERGLLYGGSLLPGLDAAARAVRLERGLASAPTPRRGGPRL